MKLQELQFDYINTAIRRAFVSTPDAEVLSPRSRCFPRRLALVMRALLAAAAGGYAVLQFPREEPDEVRARSPTASSFERSDDGDYARQGLCFGLLMIMLMRADRL